MYEELFVNTCGMFNGWHLLTIILFAVLLALLLYLSRGMTVKQVRSAHLWIAIGVSVLEVIKIYSRIQAGYGPDSWVPLYYCSLFLFAIWFSLSKWKPLQRAGYAFITMGGIVAAIFFTLYPSTSLGMYPLLHPSTLHSFVYHLVMCYTGLLFLQKGTYTPEKKGCAVLFFVRIPCLHSFGLPQ